MSPGGAAILMFCGLVYLLFGYYLFKGLVMLNAARKEMRTSPAR